MLLENPENTIIIEHKLARLISPAHLIQLHHNILRHKVHELKNLDDFNVNLSKEVNEQIEELHGRVDEACDQAEEALIEARKAATDRPNRAS